MFWLLFIIPLLLNFALAQYVPSFNLKYVLYTNLGLFLSIGYLITNINIGKLFLNIILVLFIFLFINQFQGNQVENEGWENAAENVKNYQNSKTAIIINASYKVRDFIYYYNLSIFKNYKKFNNELSYSNIFPISNLAELKKINLSNFEKIIVVLSHNKVQDPENTIIDYLESKMPICEFISDPVKAQIKIFNNSKKACINFKPISEKIQKTSECWSWNISRLVELNSDRIVEKMSLNPNQCKSIILSKEAPFSPTIEKKVAPFSKFELDLELHDLNNHSSSIVFSIEHNGKAIDRFEYSLDSFKNKKNVKVNCYLSKKYPENTLIKIYVWNYGVSNIKINSLTLYCWKRKTLANKKAINETLMANKKLI
jgi:hypothetical protein